VLREMGILNAANFETGFNSWKAAGLPVEGAPPEASGTSTPTPPPWGTTGGGKK
jgi:hypothetical protein